MDAPAPNAAALFALLQTPRAGNGVARAALRAARHLQCTVDALLEMEPRDLLQALPPGDHQTLARSIQACTPQRREAARHLVERSAKARIAFLTIDDPRYPETIRDCLGPKAPAVVSAFGERALLDRPQAAVVGARDVSTEGKQRARQCGRQAAQSDYVLISGGAKGVDDAAQKGAADTGGAVISILPQGLLTYRGPAYLHDALRERRALLLSASLPDAPWQTHAAVERNDLIAALAQTVAVIEPKKTGGSIRTARSALHYGRQVFVQCANESTAVRKDLINAGAQPLTQESNWLKESAPKRQQQPSLPGLDDPA